MHFIEQHIDDLRCRTIAKQLPKRLFMIGNTVSLYQLYEIALRVTAQSRNAKMRVLR